MRKNKWLKWLLIIAIPAIIILAVVLYLKNQTGQLVEQIDKTPVDISQVMDGEYTGFAGSGPVKAEVRLQVSDGKLEKVELLKHECGLGGKAEKIVDTIVEENKVEVDGVSGATLSSEVIKSAIRDALRKGLKKG